MRNGFTIIEVLIAIGILGLLMVMAGLSYVSLRQRVALDNSAEEVVNALRTVQSWAITGQGGIDTQCINFTASSYNAPCGCSGSTCQITHNLNGITLSPVTQINFDRLTGLTAAAVAITLTANSSTRTVQIEANGNIFKN